MNASETPMTHPDENLLAAFAEQALRGAERDRVAAHLAGCTRCRDIVFLAEEAQPVAEAAVHPRPARRLWQTAAAAASVLVVLAAALLIWEGRRLSVSRGQHEMAESVAPKLSNATISATKPSRVIERDSMAHPPRTGARSKTRARNPQELVQAQNSGSVARPRARLASVSPQSVPETSQVASAGPQPATPGSVAGAPPAPQAFGSPAVSASLASLQVAQNSVRRFAVVDGTIERWDKTGFKTVPLPSGERAEAVASNSSAVVVLSRSGKLYRSADFGEHWSPVLVQWDGTAAKLEVRRAESLGSEVQPVSSDRAVSSTAVVTASSVATATSTADNLSPSIAPKSPSFDAGAAPSAAAFVLTTIAGKRWISRDGGETWRPE